MSMWTAITLIVIVGSLSGVLMQYLKGKPEPGVSDELDQRLSALEQDNSELRSRIETLEAIVTDRSQQLKKDIEGLGQ